jgi:hypothetical protein
MATPRAPQLDPANDLNCFNGTSQNLNRCTTSSLLGHSLLAIILEANFIIRSTSSPESRVHAATLIQGFREESSRHKVQPDSDNDNINKEFLLM